MSRLGCLSTLLCVLSMGVSMPGETAENLSGRWLLTQVSVTASEVPVIGEVYATTTAQMLLDLRHEGESLAGTGEYCSLAIDSGSLVQTVLPVAFRRSLPAPRLDATVFERGGAVVLETPRSWSVVGAKLEDPVRDPLPRSGSDPAVRDHEGDGHPGATVLVRGFIDGAIRVVQRGWTELRGTLVRPGRFAGQVRFGQEQVILDATRDALRRAPKARPVWKRSRFTLVKVANDASCVGRF